MLLASPVFAIISGFLVASGSTRNSGALFLRGIGLSILFAIVSVVFVAFGCSAAI